MGKPQLGEEGRGDTGTGTMTYHLILVAPPFARAHTPRPAFQDTLLPRSSAVLLALGSRNAARSITRGVLVDQRLENLYLNDTTMGMERRTFTSHIQRAEPADHKRKSQYYFKGDAHQLQTHARLEHLPHRLDFDTLRLLPLAD